MSQAAAVAASTTQTTQARRRRSPAVAQHMPRACTPESHAAAKAGPAWQTYRFAGYQTIGGPSAVILEQRICPLCESGLMVPVEVTATRRVAHD